MTNILGLVLRQPGISRVRRNHGLEHATIHVISQKLPRTSLAGHSDAGGFWLMGNVPTDVVQEAVGEALTRLRNGERSLAVHPNCGTNFVTAGSVAGLAAASTMLGGSRRWRDQIERIPLAMTLATLGLILAQPLGYFFQEHITTSGDPEGLEIVAIMPTMRGRIKAHRVVTKG